MAPRAWRVVHKHRRHAIASPDAALDARSAAINERLDVLQALTQQTRTLLVAMIGTIVAVGSLASTLTQLA